MSIAIMIMLKIKLISNAYFTTEIDNEINNY